MPSVIEICNAALMKLGDTAIGDLTENSRAAKLCNNLWSIIRDDVFRSYPWNCLQKRATLARTATTDTWGYDYRFQLPTDPYCLRVLSVKEHDENSDVDWRVEGRCIVTDSTSCNILYIAKEENPMQYDMMLVNALAARLATELAYSLTGNAKLVEAMSKQYIGILKMARSVDAQEGHPSELYEDTWLDSRL